MPDSKIIEKIRKLLELADAERGGTEAERELAAKRAQELMLKHNLDHIAIAGTSAPGDVTQKTIRVEGINNRWKGVLYARVGQACFVDSFFTRYSKKAEDVTLVGRADNIAFVEVLCTHLIPWLEQEARDGVRADGPHNPKAYKRAFFDSASRAVYSRLHTLRSQTMGAESSTALVKNERAANLAHIENTVGKLRSSRSRGYSNAQGHAAGDDAGRRADLSPGKKLNA